MDSELWVLWSCRRFIGPNDLLEMESGWFDDYAKCGLWEAFLMEADGILNSETGDRGGVKWGAL